MKLLFFLRIKNTPLGFKLNSKELELIKEISGYYYNVCVLIMEIEIILESIKIKRGLTTPYLTKRKLSETFY